MQVGLNTRIDPEEYLLGLNFGKFYNACVVKR